jgi:hypothetical protein
MCHGAQMSRLDIVTATLILAIVAVLAVSFTLRWL